MQGEDKGSGSKKRSKVVTLEFGSGDEETIGSLFNLKNKKNPKKGKGKGKGVVVKEEDFGGLDDTLASLKKKLKGPKKGVLELDVSGLSGQTVNGWTNEGDLRIETMELGKFIDEDGLNTRIYDKMEDREKVKGVKKMKKIKDLENQGSRVKLMQNKKVCGLVLDEGLGLDESHVLGQSLNGSTNEGELRTETNEMRIAIDEEGLNAAIFDKVENKEKVKSVKKVKKNKDHGNEGLEMPELWGQQVNGPANDGDLRTETKELGKVSDGDGLNVGIYHQVENKEEAKGSKSVKKVKKSKDHENQGSRFKVTQNKKVRGLGSDPDLNDNLEDSLSVLLRKAQSGSITKCGTKLKTKPQSKIQTLKDGESFNDVERSLSSLMVSQKPPDFGNIPTDSTPGHEKTGLNQSYDEHMEEASTPVDIDVKIGSSVDRNDDPLLFSSIERPQSELNECSHKNSGSGEGLINKESGEKLDLLDHDGTGCLQNGHSEDIISDKLMNDCSLQSRELTPIKEETCSDHDGFDPPSHDMLQNDDDPIYSKKADGTSSPSVSPDQNGNDEEIKWLKTKGKKLSEVLKRKCKKRRLDDMAYEGDVDWDVLIREQGFAQSQLVEEGDLSFKENVKAAAVSAGLKAHAVGPIEKVKFKDVLKGRGGHQEYLNCRNQILALWSKDVTRVLPLTECGVTASPLVDEPPRDSLTREIYKFLSRSGYINAGIASDKEVTELSTGHNLKLVEEKTFGEKANAPDADADDGVSFILGQIRNSEASVATKSSTILDDDNGVEKTTEEKELDTPQPMVVSTILESDQCVTDELLKPHGNEESLVTKKEPRIDFCAVQSPSREGHNEMDFVSDGKKRIIVIGAGPAGLTAARHLQRHGFSVDVLEARERVGGRVYTDRSSLSVPVDLGASIITGVEADVATERRADPSSLVCAQLGLELTVLKSDCPLYDVVTGRKVPSDLDEILEAEYNSLLDDMLLLVAQKGERAMKMSLEDGLEYALKSRRIAQSGKKYIKNESSTKDDVLSPLERRVMNWHFAHLEYGCAALLQDVSLPYWNQDDIYGGFGGAHCMIKGGYSAVVESLGEGLNIHLNHIVTNISYRKKECSGNDCEGNMVKVCTSDGREFSGDAVLITIPLGCLKARDIDFSPPLPYWKDLSIQRLGFGVLNKVVMEFPYVFWDETVDYFGATAEETDLRGKCFMFWNVKKTVGAPVLIAVVVGKAAIEGQKIESSDLVNHALAVLVKLFGKDEVPEPVGSVVTDWGNDPFSYGAYSYVAIGSSGEDYDILGRPVENCLFFAGEATCKEYPDTVGGAMLSGLREAVRIIDLMITGNDYTAEVEALEAVQRHSDSERNEVRDIAKRLEAIELSNAIYKNSIEGARTFTRKSLLKDMFCNTRTTAGRLLLAKELLSLPVEALKSFAGTKAGLSILNTWILDSMGKDGTQLLRHCVRLLVLVSTDLLAVRLSGVGKTIKEKVCVHTSRDIRAVASQLVNVWIEVFRKEKASNSGLKLLRQSIPGDSSRSKSLASGNVHLRAHGLPNNKRSHLPPSANIKKMVKPVKLDTKADSKMELKSSKSQGSVGVEDENDHNCVMSEEEKAAFAAAEAARAAALAAAEAYASSEAKCNTSLPLPKIPSFHKFTRREQYIHMDDFDVRKKCSGGTLGRQDCVSETDSRNCRVRDMSVAFPAAYASLENSNNNNSVDNLSHRSHSIEITGQLSLREHSAESEALDTNIYTKAWVDGCGSEGLKDYNAIDRWQNQAAAAESDFYHQSIVVRDEEDSNVKSKLHLGRHEGIVHDSSVSQVTVNRDLVGNQSRGAESIKQAVVDFVASLLMPLYKAKKFDKDAYKAIMKKTATKVMEQTTDAEKGMAVYEFLDYKRKTKIRAFVDKLIEKHMGTRPVVKP